jgi:catechol 2,3-dioxygenase-like lactoylglutathione lyase family enzyme
MPGVTLGVAIVFVKDIKRMADFYHEALGLPLVATLPGAPSPLTGWVELDAGNVRLALHAIAPRVAKQIEITSPPRAREEAATKLVFRVDDLDGARRRLSSHGATMFEPKSWSACDGLDPEGNVFQIVGP